MQRKSSEEEDVIHVDSEDTDTADCVYDMETKNEDWI